MCDSRTIIDILKQNLFVKVLVSVADPKTLGRKLHCFTELHKFKSFQFFWVI